MTSASVSKRDCIKKVNFFSDLTDQQADDIAAGLLDSRFKEGQTIFSHGEEGDALYILTEGKVELFIHDYAGEKIVLKVVTPGDYFGELAALGGVARTATAVALEPCTCYELTRNQLLDFLHRKPAASIEVLATLSKAISRTDTMLSNRISRSVVNEMMPEELGARVLQKMAAFCGSLPFILINAVIIICWMFWNAGADSFDPYPYNTLSFLLSLEILLLIALVLNQYTLQSARDQIHKDIEYEVSLKAEIEIASLNEKIELYHQEYMKYFQVLVQSKAL